MSHFRSRPHPLTGKIEWELVEDYARDIARSGYADMLNDVDRNHRYNTAIVNAVASIKRAGRRVKVLDIGSGTGLLSMMAARAGADEVYACECFHPMYLTSLKVTKANQMENIKIIPKRSTELTLEDIPKCNVLITETFDTELIGEDCINTYNHAIANFMEENFLAVPTSAEIHVQLVQSKMIEDFHVIDQLKGTESCPGLNTVHDLQLSLLKEGKDFTATNPVQLAFKFDFTKEIPTSCSTVLKGRDYNAAFLFWKLQMGDGHEISCFPKFLDEKYYWREHWIQCAYYIVPELRRDEIKLSYDKFFYYFGENECNCVCGYHRKLARSRIYTINNLENIFSDFEFDEILFLSDNSILPKHLRCNRLEIVGSNIFGFKSDKVEHYALIGEPSFESSLCSMHDLQFFHLARAYSYKEIFPNIATVKLMFVKFQTLYKIQSKVGVTEGFDLSHFDNLIQGSIRNVSDTEIHPVWQYEHEMIEILDLFSVGPETGELERAVNIPKNANAAIFYPEFHFKDKILSDYYGGYFKKGTNQLLTFLCNQTELKLNFNLKEGLRVISV